MYFSPELFNTNKLNLGYNYTINRGYLFEKHEVFANFIKDLYSIKQSVTKNDPWYLISKLLMNSLYGRFGMDPNYTSEKHSIIDISEFTSYELKYDILNYTIIEDKFLISYIDSDINNNINNSKAHTNVSVVISSAITAYARIFMSRFKNNKKFKLFYTDTDSLYVNKPLDIYYKNLIGKDLGQFKLEVVFDEAVFLAPKVYGGIVSDTNNKIEITKVKGYKNILNYNQLKSLLKKDSKLELNQEKWFKSISDGDITIKDQIYTLTSTDNKRELIYSDNLLINTKPFIITG